MVITAVTGCTDVFPITVNCSMPANISIQTGGVGNLFTVPQLLRLTIAGDNRYVSVYLNTSDSTNSTLWATVAPSGYNPMWMGSTINISFYTTGSPTSVFPGFTFAPEPVPALTSISGCTGSGLATTSCAPDTAMLTIQGSGIGWLTSGSMQLRIGTNVVTSPLRAVNSTYGTLSLTNVYYSLLLPEHYNGVLLSLQFQGYFLDGSSFVIFTNALSISFIPSATTFCRGGIHLSMRQNQ